MLFVMSATCALAMQPAGESGPQAESPAAAQWSAEEIEAARAQCAVLLKGLDVVAEPAEPWREDGQCGTPAPMRLISIGKNPQVALSPPVALTCEMIAALHKWVQRDLQPLARKHLGAPLARIDTMSSYSCRTAYNRIGNRLSEHGKVNALDIAGFVTARRQTASVLSDWGPTAREIALQAATAAKVQPPGAHLPGSLATTAPKGPAPASQMATGALRNAPAANAAGPALPAMPGITFGLGQGAAGDASQMGWTPSNRLGGPKSQATGAGEPAVDGRIDFLRNAHRTACAIFGTVLGPEANKAHKNHFHVDMANRKGFIVCE